MRKGPTHCLQSRSFVSKFKKAVWIKADCQWSASRLPVLRTTTQATTQAANIPFFIKPRASKPGHLVSNHRE